MEGPHLLREKKGTGKTMVGDQPKEKRKRMD